MEYVFPHKGYVDITDQFMLGNNILVTPYLSKGEGSREVILPKGKWKSDTGELYNGGKKITIRVPLTRLPYFVNINSN